MVNHNSHNNKMEELDKSYKGNGFKVPEGYFEQLNIAVNDRLYPGSAKWKVAIGRALSVAASVAVIISIGLLSYKSAQPESAEIGFNELDSMDIVNYSSSVDISDEELEEIVSEEAIDAIYQTEIVTEQSNKSTIPQEEIDELEEEFNFLDI